MQYLNWCEHDKYGHPEWVMTVSITPMLNPGDPFWNPVYLLQDWPLFAYDYEVSIGKKAVEEQSVQYSPLSLIFPLNAAYHRLDAAMMKETLIDIKLERKDHIQTIRTIFFGKCTVIGLKEYHDEVTLTVDYLFKSDRMKTQAGVHFFTFNYETYAGIEGSIS